MFFYIIAIYFLFLVSMLSSTIRETRGGATSAGYVTLVRLYDRILDYTSVDRGVGRIPYIHTFQVFPSQVRRFFFPEEGRPHRHSFAAGVPTRGKTVRLLLYSTGYKYSLA